MSRPGSLALLFFALLLTAGGVRAATQVRVLDTYPSGEPVVLGSNQNFYLRIGYSTDQPISIWARPYYQGQAVRAGSNPSPTYTGSGEALGWFFFMQPGDRVDEIRITAGDGTISGTPLVATHPVRIVAGSGPAAPASEPAWVSTLRTEQERLQQEAFERRMSTPPGAGETLFLSGFMFAVLGLCIAGIVAPAWALWRWQGGWRVAAAVPAALVAFVILRIIVDTARDPTSHNLWPFEIVMVGLASLVVVGVLLGLRKLSGVAHS